MWKPREDHGYAGQIDTRCTGCPICSHLRVIRSRERQARGLRASSRWRLLWATKGPSASIRSCRDRSRGRYSATVKPGTIHTTLRRKWTTAAMSWNSIRSRRHAGRRPPGRRPRRRRGRGRGAGPTLRLRLRAEEVLDELEDAAGPTCWAKYVPPGCRRARSPPVRVDRVPAADQVEGVVREGQRRVLRCGDDHDAARTQQRGGLGDVRRPALGRHGEQRRLPPARAKSSTSPPPVWMSSAAVAPASRSPRSGRTPTRAAPRWPAPRTRRSPSPRWARRRPRRRGPRTCGCGGRSWG